MRLNEQWIEKELTRLKMGWHVARRLIVTECVRDMMARAKSAHTMV